MQTAIERRGYACARDLASAFARHASWILKGSLQQRQNTSLVLPGGSTPQRFLPALCRQRLAWERIMVTLSDERWVDTGSETSNQHLISALMSRHPATAASLVGLKTDDPEPATALARLDERLGALPQPFDLTVLGLGEDGHIASLFPGQVLSPDDGHLCLAVTNCPPPAPRVSLGLPAIAASRHIALVYMDAGKSALMDAVLAGSAETRDLPVAQLLRATRAPVVIFETVG